MLRLRWAMVALGVVVAVTAGPSLGGPSLGTAPAAGQAVAAQPGSERAVVDRLRDVRATRCRNEGVDLTATRVVEVPDGAVTATTVEVTNGIDRLSLGTTRSTARGDTQASEPFTDDVLFATQWTPGLPFTVEVTRVVTVRSRTLWRQELAVECAAPGDGVVTATEWSAPQAPQGATPGPQPRVPDVVSGAYPRVSG